MKIGIMTFWWSQDNYGQLLQCYALQKYLRDIGHDAFLIRYRQLPRKHGLIEKLWKYGCHPWCIMEGFSRVAKRRQTRQYESQHNRHFDEFRNKYIVQSEHEYTTIAELRQNPPKADIYVVGSDQVWNVMLDYRIDDVEAYFLGFGDENVRRVAYAASWGISKLPRKYCQDVKMLLGRFEVVSCREKTGVDICASLGVQAEQVCDPTFLLNESDWRSLGFNAPVQRRRDYVFVYMIGSDCVFSAIELCKWAEKHNLVVVYVKGNASVVSSFQDEKIPTQSLAIEEWINGVSQARYVFTNSFHCAVFSAILGKTCGVVPMGQSKASTNDRFISLYNELDSVPLWVRNNDFDVVLENHERVEVNSLQTSGRHFLCNVLGEAT